MGKLLSLISIAALFSTIGFTAQASQLEVNKTYISSLNNFQMDGSSTMLKNVRAGYLQMLLTDKGTPTMALTMYRPFFCPPGKMCAMVMPLPLTVQVPVLDIQTNQCGITTYSGLADMPDHSGAVQKLTVTDNTSNTCPTLVALPETEVTYEVDVPRGETSVSHMHGDKLHAQVLAQIQ
jgi:hypothetical protein